MELTDANLRKKRQFIIVLMLALTASGVAITGCVEDEPSLRTAKSSITFNAFDVFQRRGASKNVERHEENEQRGLFPVALGNPVFVATAELESFPERDSQGNDSCPQSAGTGSGALTSDSYVTTAAHVLGALPTKADAAACPQGSVELWFGASVTDSGPSERFRPDHGNDFGEYRCAVTGEIDPLFPNRLMSLGLEPIARSTESDARTTLLGWTARVAWSSLDYTGGTPSLDVAMLDVCAKESADFRQFPGSHPTMEPVDLSTGPVLLDKPGVFFNQVVPQEPEDVFGAVVSTDEPPPASMLSYNRWGLEVDESTSSAALGHFGGGVYEWSPGTATTRACVHPNNGTGAAVIQTVINERLKSVTLDAREGSSGGAVLSRLGRGDSFGGVIPSSLSDTQVAVGVSTRGTSDEAVEDWLEPDESFGYVFWSANSGHDSEFEVAVSKEGNEKHLATMLDATAVIVARFDINYHTDTDGYDPPPVEDPGSPLCMKMVADNCVSYGRPARSEGSGEGYDSPEVVHPAPVSGTTVVDEPPDPNWEKQPLNFTCDRVNKASVAYGIIGTAMLSYDAGIDNAVRSLQFICGPYSAATWTMNWPDLYTTGPAMGGTTVAGLPKRARSYWLRELLPAAAEWRTPRGWSPRTRPMSMKMCPPNYLMVGMDVYLRREPVEYCELGECQSDASDLQGAVLVGIHRLICEPALNIADQRHVRAMNGLAQAGGFPEWDRSDFPNPYFAYLHEEDANVSGYTMCDEPFSLTQKIGEPRIDGADLIPLRCPTGQVVNGMYVIHRSDHPIENLELQCTDAPELGGEP